MGNKMLRNIFKRNKDDDSSKPSDEELRTSLKAKLEKAEKKIPVKSEFKAKELNPDLSDPIDLTPEELMELQQELLEKGVASFELEDIDLMEIEQIGIEDFEVDELDVEEIEYKDPNED